MEELHQINYDHQDSYHKSTDIFLKPQKISYIQGQWKQLLIGSAISPQLSMVDQSLRVDILRASVQQIYILKHYLMANNIVIYYFKSIVRLILW